MDMVQQLARATICYRSPGCSVVVVDRWVATLPPAARRFARAALKEPSGPGGVQGLPGGAMGAGARR
jgi:hypothetical protein